jgi:hypothetical protein
MESIAYPDSWNPGSCQCVVEISLPRTVVVVGATQIMRDITARVSLFDSDFGLLNLNLNLFDSDEGWWTSSGLWSLVTDYSLLRVNVLLKSFHSFNGTWLLSIWASSSELHDCLDSSLLRRTDAAGILNGTCISMASWTLSSGLRGHPLYFRVGPLMQLASFHPFNCISIWPLELRQVNFATVLYFGATMQLTSFHTFNGTCIFMACWTSNFATILYLGATSFHSLNGTSSCIRLGRVSICTCSTQSYQRSKIDIFTDLMVFFDVLASQAREAVDFTLARKSAAPTPSP